MAVFSNSHILAAVITKWAQPAIEQFLSGRMDGLPWVQGVTNKVRSTGWVSPNWSLGKEIALLKADKYTDQKIVETTAYLMNKINEVSAEVRANKDAQCAINTQQAVYNGTNTATLGCLQRQVDELVSMSKRVIPSFNVCDTGCCCNS